MPNRYKVLRAHEGDRHYREGEIREGQPSELKHLVPNVLEDLGPISAGEKASPGHKNKAAPDPFNKTQPLGTTTVKRQGNKPASEI